MNLWKLIGTVYGGVADGTNCSRSYRVCTTCTKYKNMIYVLKYRAAHPLKTASVGFMHTVVNSSVF